ncbi:MAG: Eco57I restriction-modification methylase domain-containing protein, partial [Planctomycetota bacterium]
MPADAKPLFRPDVLHAHVTAFALPAAIESVRDDLAKWADLVASGRIDRFKETELLPEFITLFFNRVLGYRGASDGGVAWTLSHQRHVEVEGEFADAVLGRFANGQPPRYTVAVEVKGPKDPLDRPFAGRRLSAVDQGYRYAINLPCDWLIVTSMREIRLHSKSADQHSYEAFDTEAVARDEAVLKRFVFLLGADRIVPESGVCHLAGLLAESERVGRELTRTFYDAYAGMRLDMFGRLAADNPGVPRAALVGFTQRILDRVLFCAFCEDRGLLPADTLKKAYEHADPYHPRPIWENFRGLFAAVNRGNAALGIHAYNGGLFADTDPGFESLVVADEVCRHFRDLGSYDYRDAAAAALAETGRSLIDVDILGHIFEQSIADLERLRDDTATPEAAAKKKTSRRKSEGVFYTPSFVTRTIVEQALGGVVADRFDSLRKQREADAKGAAKAALAEPTVYRLDALKPPARTALVEFWEAWQDELATVRLLDPACGSGAFLIEAFDQLHATYQASNDRLQELRGHRSLFDLDKRILEHNLYGVDLNEEAVEICRLSLWIKTAARGKALTSLDHTIRSGNSIVADPSIHPRAVDWQAMFPHVFAAGGFDVVVGNPPYVRQELLGPIKPYLQEHYAAYHGMADLYVYFYELGLNVLKPGGLLSFIVTNKWMKAGYGEPLRKLLAETSWIESVVDFGHAKQIFEDADVFPSIIVARKPAAQPAKKPKTARLCAIPREQLRIDDLSRQIAEEGTALPLEQLSSAAWQLEPGGVNQLLAKLQAQGAPLGAFAAVHPLRGVLTGLNEAFILDAPTYQAIKASDNASAGLMKPNLRGQDIDRWQSTWGGLWMIVIASSDNQDWPWSNGGDQAEAIFAKTFPAIYQHLSQFKQPLMKRQDKGRFWWELRSCAYWQEFAKPKIMYQEIQFHPCYALDRTGSVANNKVFMLPTDNLYLLGVLNSPLTWWHNWRYLPHMKDEALSPAAFLMKDLPIAEPTDEIREGVTGRVERLLAITAAQHDTARTLLDWLAVEHAIEKPTQRLQAFVELDSDGFVAEVKKIRGRKNPLSAAAVKHLRDEFARSVEPAQALAREAV